MYMIKVLATPYDNTRLFSDLNEANRESDRLTRMGLPNEVHDSDNGYPYTQTDRQQAYFQQPVNSFSSRVESNYHIW